MQKHEYNFRHNAMFSGVTLKGIMLEISSIIYLTLDERVMLRMRDSFSPQIALQ